jgi:hypothetical protein
MTEEFPREPPEKPREVEFWEKQLKVNILGWRREVPPGFRYPVWVLWVRDEGTDEVVRVVMGYPYTELNRYKIVKITSKAGYPVNVIVPVDEAPKVAPKIPPHPEVGRVVEESGERVAKVAPPEIKKAVEEVVKLLATKPFKWGEFKADVKHFYERIPAWERAVEEKSDVALYGYLVTFRDKMRVWLERIGRELPEVHARVTEVEARRTLPPPRLSKEEIEKLWSYFSRVLREHGVDPGKYKELFDEDVALAKKYEEALVMIEDDLKYIVVQEELKKMTFEAGKPKARRFSWKDVSRGVAYIKIKLMILLDAIEKKNLLASYTLVRDIVDATHRLLELLQRSPTVRRFRDMTGLG